MAYYVRVGEVPAKRHTWHRGPNGGRLYEELMGEDGFSGPSSLLYHLRSPSAITAIEAVSIPRAPVSPNVPLAPWHLRLQKLEAGGDPVLGRHVVLANRDVAVCWVEATTTSGLYRNAAGDELVYVQSGRALLESVFGTLEVDSGDYVSIPASTTHRWVLPEGGALQCLVFEATGHVGLPARYLTPTGQLKEGAPFSERDLRLPAGPLVVEEGDQVDVLVRSRQGWARHVQASHPFDVVGWDGCAYPFAFSIKDFEPIVGRIHQPPPVHQTFAGPGFVICSFVPRPYDFDPQAIKVPYHHANVDSDEVLFYSSGEFMSRRGAGISEGSMTLHPAGFVHGPQPGSVEAALEAQATEETAVMMDTFSPLAVSADARAVADPDYPWSWAQPG